MLAWEIVLIFHKHHFWNLLTLFAVLSIFFLKYFDQNYIKLVLSLLGISILLDLLWLIVLAGVLMKYNSGLLESIRINSAFNPSYRVFGIYCGYDMHIDDSKGIIYLI